MYKVGLSILIPVFNRPCGDLVRQLHLQAVETAIDFEIIVVEDGSTNLASMKQNRSLTLMEHVRYIIHQENKGRSAIRNWLADEAQFDTLLYLDCDMDVQKSDFLQCYLREKASVVCGGLRIGGDAHLLRHNLRYHYERAFEKQHPLRRYEDNTCMDFHTANVLITHRVMDICRFDERFKRYGYEDVLFGKTLQQTGFSVTHIDNPVCMTQYETNACFIKKTEEAMHTLHDFHAELYSHSRLLKLFAQLKRFGLLPFMRITHYCIGKLLRQNLCGERPVYPFFHLYKLLYYASLERLS